ncbi:MAG: SH3 domain-containing protein [Acidobacteriota bacterium]
MMTGFFFQLKRVILKIILLMPILLQGTALFCLAEQPIILKIIKPEASLFKYNDAESEIIGTVQADDEVTLKMEVFSQTTWYLVETVDGQIGWLRSADVEPPQRAEPAAREKEARFQFGSGSTWRATTINGRTVGGTWTGNVNISTGTASGSWAVVNGSNRIVLQGTWSAIKYEREWRGSWRALVNGKSREYSGAWISRLKLDPNSTLVQLFEQAENEEINGTWQSAGQSGSWSIRVIPMSDP